MDDPQRGPNNLGIAHYKGWVGYLRNNTLFIKRFQRVDKAAYPDGGMNFETFANEDFLELESIGPLVTLAPGESVTHEETWSLHQNIPACRSEADIDSAVLPLVNS